MHTADAGQHDVDKGDAGSRDRTGMTLRSRDFKTLNRPKKEHSTGRVHVPTGTRKVPTDTRSATECATVFAPLKVRGRSADAVPRGTLWRPKHTPVRYVRRVLVALLTCSGCAWLPSEPSWVRKCSSWADTSYAGGYEIIVAAEWCEPVHVEKRWVGVR